jgi:hypothetical protein
MVVASRKAARTQTMSIVTSRQLLQRNIFAAVTGNCNLDRGISTQLAFHWDERSKIDSGKTRDRPAPPMATPGSLGVPPALLNQAFSPTAYDDLSNNPEAKVIWSADILMRPSGLMEGGQLPFGMIELKNHKVICRRRADLSFRQDRCRFSDAGMFARRDEKPLLILDSS